jgi:GPI-anchor transamidase subunit S
LIGKSRLQYRIIWIHYYNHFLILHLSEYHPRYSLFKQIQNYASLPIAPQQQGTGYDLRHVLAAKDLTQFINSAEWNFASVVSSSPPIHFVVYVPEQDISPLHIVNNVGEIIATNAFLVPQWGGIIIQNLEFKDTILTSDGLKTVLEVFAFQLRILMGVEPLSLKKMTSLLPGFDIHIEASDHGITKWELDRILRQRSIQNVKDSISTLNSLSRLLKSLETIVVQDHISNLVMTSLNALESV